METHPLYYPTSQFVDNSAALVQEIAQMDWMVATWLIVVGFFNPG